MIAVGSGRTPMPAAEVRKGSLGEALAGPATPTTQKGR
jgi:hypothetical protein